MRDPPALCAAMTRAVEALRWSMNEPDDEARKAKAMEAVDEVRREMGLPVASCCLPGGPCYEAGLGWARHTHEWQTAPAHGLERAVADFKAALPGWWFSVGECQVSADASCGPTRESDHIALIPLDRRFDDGFHADLPQPATMVQALETVRVEALAAIASALPPPPGGE